MFTLCTNKQGGTWKKVEFNLRTSVRLSKIFSYHQVVQTSLPDITGRNQPNHVDAAFFI